MAQYYLEEGVDINNIDNINTMSQLGKLNSADFIKGAVVAILVVVLGMFEQSLTAHGLDVGSYDWGSILNATVLAFVAYLGKNISTDSNGAMLGVADKA